MGSCNFSTLDKGSRTGWACLVLVVGLCWASPSFAQRFPPDPVVELQTILANDRDINKNQFALDLRKANLEKRLAALSTLGDVSRALLLQDWRLSGAGNENVTALDRAAWDALNTRFKTTVLHVLRTGSPTQQRTVVALLGEMAVQNRTVSKDSLLHDSIRELSKELLKLVETNPDPGVRDAIARSLCRIGGEASKIVKALEAILVNGGAAERHSVVEALAELVSMLRENERKTLRIIEATKMNVDFDPRLLEVRNLLSASEVVSELAPRCLLDPDVHIRRTVANSLLQITLLASVRVDLPLKSVKFPTDRPLTEEETKALQSYKDDLRNVNTVYLPFAERLATALAPDKNPALGLAQASLDTDPLVRRLARRTIEEIAILRNKLQQKGAVVPDVPLAPRRVNADANERIKFVVADRPGLLEVQAGEGARGRTPQAVLDEVLPLVVGSVTVGLLDADPMGRLAAVEALEALGDFARRAAPALLRSMTDPDRFVRWAAARAFGKMGALEVDGAVDALTKMLCDVDLDLQLVGALGLRQYGPAAKESVQVLSLAVLKGDVELKIAAMDALESIGPDAVSALPSIAATLQSPSSRVRKTAAEVLGRFGPLASEHVEGLRSLLLDKESDVRKAASDALLSIETADVK